MLAALLNGSPIADSKHSIDVEERGLSYGHGVFETMQLRAGAVRYVDDHLARLKIGCERLGIATPPTTLLLSEFKQLAQTAPDGIIKLIVTRGPGGRGYRASESITPTRLAMLYPKPDASPQEIAVRWCETRLARNSQLAGIKHLNRLEQVLAQNEWHDAAIAEGLMLDTEGEIVSATSSNVFIVSDGMLVTSDLKFSGVRGVMRQQVLKTAERLGIQTAERSLWPTHVHSASEVFLTNAVRGIRAVTCLGEQRWQLGPVTRRLIEALLK